MRAIINTKPKHCREYTFIIADEKYPIDIKFKKTVSNDKIKAISTCTAAIVADIELGAEQYRDREGVIKCKPIIWVSDFKINSRTAEPTETSTVLPF